ncbi:hypothetical protein EPA93_36080 [Ktedonosporobacter rubrisoli]|uniref:Uncharacterized protein n=1 Tax=Ktedonosporobacter rubrisoli TaxID=2509675 RepID=A0A4P6JZZ7_KTERU|nr:hypothetical protein [Ktedonosporobacter rubrisoli]QBD81103.1 hypothetical protein EPA93_36080 [Ktedonosporobacter rubrisoli]
MPEDSYGEPDYGRVMRHFRKHVKRWSAERLALLYSEMLEEASTEDMSSEELITARWIQRMEQRNEVPRDPKRRWILATLLGIPPALLGLQALAPLLEIDNIFALNALKEDKIDVLEYRAYLSAYWQHDYVGSKQHFLHETQMRIQHLTEHILYYKTEPQEEIARLLCEYHMAFAWCIAHDYGLFTMALRHLDQAIRLSDEKGYLDLSTALRYRRGGVIFTLAEAAAATDSLQRATTYFAQAIADFDLACNSLKRVAPELRGAVLLAAGHTRAYITQDQADLGHALALIDKSEQFINQGNDAYFVGFNEERYSLDRGRALIASPIRQLRSPQKIIDQCSSFAPDISQKPRHYSNNLVIQARAYLDLDYYPIAVAYAEEALQALQGITSQVNIARIAHLYGRLKASSYGNSREVAQLGVALLKKQHPSLFQ